MKFNTLLVPIDFSPISQYVFEQALGLLSDDSPMLILLHVLDASAAAFAESHGLGSQEEVLKKMRAQAESAFQEYAEKHPEHVQVETIISEGLPFLEILRKSEDFEVDAIVMGKFGSGAKFQKLFFGTTAERVLRGSAFPVIVLPPPAEPSDS